METTNCARYRTYRQRKGLVEAMSPQIKGPQALWKAQFLPNQLRNPPESKIRHLQDNSRTSVPPIVLPCMPPC